MMWASWDAFLSMGGYGLYVWGSYSVCVFALVAEAVMVRRRLASTLDQLKIIANKDER